MTRRPRGARKRARATIPLLALALASLWTALPGAGGAAPVDPEAFTRLDADAPALAIRATSAGTDAPLALAGRRLLQGSREVYLASAQLSDLCGTRRDWQAAQHRLTLAAADRTFALTAGSRLVVGAGREVLLRTPPLVFGGDLWVPMELLTEVIAPALGRTARWDAASLALDLGVEPGQQATPMTAARPRGALPEPPPSGPFSEQQTAPAQTPERPLRVRTVVVDPGHGGEETGRIGPRGTQEKDVNLAVARELQRRLERAGLKAVLTRDEDVTLPLARRAEIANQAAGDLFVSLHCNGWFHADATGVETFFLSPAKTDRDASVAREENAEAGTVGEDISFILWDLVQNGFIDESSELAETLQAALCDALGTENRGVKQAGFRVLVGAYMPAVLVEMGFLSNRDEETRLADAEHQRLIARTVCDAILAFRDRHAATVADEAALDERGRP